jgi:5-formyltetrahydrofolate cyclo-ligase
MKEKIRSKIKKDFPDLIVNMQKSALIINTLIGLDVFIRALNIHCYVSTESEVDTHWLVNYIIHKNKYAIVPFIDGGLKSSLISKWDDLALGAFGILEPAKKKIVPDAQIDLVIVPGTAFDERGHRIGKGKGYYDRFLSGVAAKKIALAFEFQVLSKIPCEEHDIKMDYIITEKRVIRCK